MEEKYREVATVFLLLHSLLLAYHRIIILDLFLIFFSFSRFRFSFLRRGGDSESL